MKKKLTLSVEAEILNYAKKISQQKNQSVSRLFEQWIKSIRESENSTEDWLDQFHRKNVRFLDKVDDDQVESLLEKRGEKWR